VEDKLHATYYVTALNATNQLKNANVNKTKMICDHTMTEVKENSLQTNFIKKIILHLSGMYWYMGNCFECNNMQEAYAKHKQVVKN